jgi:hypothetical protein
VFILATSPIFKDLDSTHFGSACGPVIIPVFKTGGRRVFPSPVGSTPTRFRQIAIHPSWFSSNLIRTVELCFGHRL